MKPDNTLTTDYLTKYPDAAARVIENLPQAMTADLFENLSPDNYLPAFENLTPSFASGLLEAMQEKSASKLIDALSDRYLATLLNFYDDPRKKKILSQLPSSRRKKVIRQMLFPPNSVGSVMLPPTMALTQNITVAEALKRFKRDRRNNHSELVVLDKTLHYIGIITIGKLIHSLPDTKLSSILQYKFDSLPARKPLQNLTGNPAWAYVRILPVTDERGILIGIVDYATVLQHEETTLPQTTARRKSHPHTLEFLFQTLATLIEAIVDKLLPTSRNSSTKDRQHDNVM